MARRKKRKFKSDYSIIGDFLHLQCACGIELDIPHHDRPVGELLDEQAIGWYTDFLGQTVCPSCVRHYEIINGPIGQYLTAGVHPWKPLGIPSHEVKNET